MELKERVIVVTGAGQGLGKQFALDCASGGARLVAVLAQQGEGLL